MATRSILGSINNAASLSLINGTVDIIANSLSSNSLAPGTTVKTDTAGSLISADLTKSDIVDLGDILTNPLTGDLDAGGSDILNVGNINTTTLNSKTPFYQTTTEALDMNNNAINNVSIVNFPTGQYIDGQDGSALNLYTEGDVTIACSQVVIGDNIATNYTLPTVRGADNSIMTLGTDGASSWSNTLVNQVGTNSSNITTLQNKTQYQTVNVPAQTTIFTGIVNASTTLAVGTAQPGQTGYNLPPARPLVAGYVMVTPASSGNTLQFQVAADASKIQNLTASTGQSTFTGILNVGSDLKVNGVSTLVGGILANQKIILTKNIIEIQEDNVQTEAITIGNLATTGFSIPRTNGGISGQELRLQSDNKLGWYSPSTYIRFFRNTTLGSVTLLTSPTATRISIFPLLITESTSPFPVFTTTASGAQYTPIEPRKAFQMSYNTMATIATNPSGGEYVFRLIHRKAGPVEAVISAFRLVMTKDVQYTISLQAVGFDILQNDVLDVSIEGSIASTIQLDSQQVSIIAH